MMMMMMMVVVVVIRVWNMLPAFDGQLYML